MATWACVPSLQADLDIGRVLGEGNFGKVMVVSPAKGSKAGKNWPQFMALKMQNKKDMAKDKKEIQHIRDEKNLMFAMQSKFLVGCVDYFQDKKHIFFLLELCNAGEMWSIIQQQKKKRIPTKACKFWLVNLHFIFPYLYSHNYSVTT